MDLTLADYIKRTMAGLDAEKEQQPTLETTPNDYEVMPEDDGTDSKRNPYSRV